MRLVQEDRLRALRRRDGGSIARLEDGLLVRELPRREGRVRASRAGRTGRSWYGSYAVSYADPTAEGGARWVGGHTNKRRAVAAARRYVEQEGAAWAEIREGNREGAVIARFPKVHIRDRPGEVRRDLIGLAVTKKPHIAYWIRSRGVGGRDAVPVYVLGTCRRADEGIVGHDLRVRPLRLGKGPYTMVVSPDDVEEKP